MRIELASTGREASRTFGAQGSYLRVKSAQGLFAMTVKLRSGRHSEYDEMTARQQIQFDEELVSVTVRNLSGASNVMVIDTGFGRFLDNEDGQRVIIDGTTGSVAVTGPLTDGELRATPVPVSGALTDGELRATPVPVDVPGTVVVVQAPAVSGGLERQRIITTASTNATSIKGAPGQVYALNGTNTSGGTLFLKLYDKATAPVVGTDVPAETYALEAGKPFSFTFGGQGVEYANGIAAAITGAIADNDTTNTAANDVVMVVHYA